MKAALLTVVAASLVSSLAALAAGIVGTDRAETIRGTVGADRISARAGDDRVFGLAGDDVLTGGLGRDVVDGGAGADRLLLRDGDPDVARCGRGRDTVLADGADTVFGDCETLQISPPLPLAPPPRPVVPGPYGGRTTQGELVVNRSGAGIRQPVFMAATLWLTPVLAVGLYGLGIPTPAALAIALVAAAVVAAIVSEPLASTLRPAESSRVVMIAVTIVTLVAIVQIARLSVFMGNVNRRDLSMDPSDVWRTQHCCLTAYSEAARFAAENTHNIYETSLYEPRFMDDLKVDPYHYPPAFLLLPRALQLVTDDFLRLRAVWFSIQALVLGGIALFLPWWIGGKPGAYALAGAVLFLATPQSLFSLQQGNFQTTAIAVAVGASSCCGRSVSGRLPSCWRSYRSRRYFLASWCSIWQRRGAGGKPRGLPCRPR